MSTSYTARDVAGPKTFNAHTVTGSKLAPAHVIVATNEEGAEPYSNDDVDETGDNMATSKANLYSLAFFNDHATDIRYARVYDKATAPANGSDATQKWLIPLVAKQWTVVPISEPVSFADGIGLRSTTGKTASDTGAPGSNEVICVASFKD